MISLISSALIMCYPLASRSRIRASCPSRLPSTMKLPTWATKPPRSVGSTRLLEDDPLAERRPARRRPSCLLLGIGERPPPCARSRGPGRDPHRRAPVGRDDLRADGPCGRARRRARRSPARARRTPPARRPPPRRRGGPRGLIHGRVSTSSSCGVAVESLEEACRARRRPRPRMPASRRDREQRLGVAAGRASRGAHRS